MATDTDIKKDYECNYNDAIGVWSGWYAEADRDMAFYLSDQWTDKDKQILAQEGRSAYVFNLIKRVVNMISGYQYKNRLSTTCQPVEQSDDATAELFSDLLLYEMGRGGYNCLSEAFKLGALVTGINLLSVYVDYRDDYESGDIRITREPYNSFILDPNFSRLDLQDCGYYIRRRYVSKDEAKLLLPGQSSDVNILPLGVTDNKFSYMKTNNTYASKNLMAYDEYWRRTTQKKDLLIDNFTGQTRIWDGNREQLRAFKSEYPWIETRKIIVPAVELHSFLQGELMRTTVNPYGLDEYPCVPVVGVFAPEFSRQSYKLQSVVRSIIDPQEEFNKMRSRMSDILASQVNSGWITREGAVKNKADLYRTGQGVVIERSMDSQPADLQKIQPGDVSQSMFALAGELNQNIMEIPGANEELMGVSDNGNTEMSGVLAKIRSANGLTTLQDLFDNLAYSQKMLGQKIIKLIQNNYSPEKIQRITGKQPTQEFYDQDFGKYDCVVREAMLTDTQKQLAYAQALQARNAGIAIPDSFIIEMMPIADKEELKKAYQEQAQQAQAQQDKINEQEILQRKLINAETIHKLSLAEQQRQRGVADLALSRERLSQVEQNKASALLDLSKSMTEIQGMKQEQIIAAIQFLQNLQEATKNEDRQDILMTSAALTDDVYSKEEDISKTKQEKELEKMQQLQQSLGNIQ